jgi:soluble lytic murein transglycosylase-like protein
MVRAKQPYPIAGFPGIFFFLAGILVCACGLVYAEESPITKPPAGSVQKQDSQSAGKDSAKNAAKAAPKSGVKATSNDKRTPLRQFIEKDGSITFTNRPEKYQSNANFVEVDIHYQPIVVPIKYKRYSSPNQYPTGTIQECIRRYAQQYGLDENLVYAVIKIESNFSPASVSNKGARGLMQLMPGTAEEMGVTNIYDVAQNIAGGTQYLAKMLEIFNGDKRLALAGYNAGPESVKQYGGVPPFPETQAYVNNVLTEERRFRDGSGKIKTNEVERVRVAPSQPPLPQIADTKRYLVHFNSGLTQPADRVLEKDAYYYIEYGKHTYPVRKELVNKIDEPA